MDEKEFDNNIKEWTEYCKTSNVMFSSNPRTITECDAYRKILSMNYEALPLIRKLYDKNSSDNFSLSCIKGHGLIQLVNEIVGNDFQIPNNIAGRIKEMESYTKNWLDENMDRYLE